MKIYSLQIGYGIEIKDEISLNIYLSGCKNNKNCERNKCHNPELKDFRNGNNYSLFKDNINKFIKNNLIGCIVLLGGEPLDQNCFDLKDLILYIKSKCNLPIYLYSGYNYEEKSELITKLFKIGIDGFCLGPYKENGEKKWLYKKDYIKEVINVYKAII